MLPGGAFAAASAAPAGLPAAIVPTSDTFVPVPGPVFGDPTATRNEIVTRLLDNIEHTPKGATIRIVAYSFTLSNVATALLNAHSRGVDVKIVLDGHSRDWSPAKRLVPALGTDVTKRSFIVLTRGSARGTSGVTHQKSWTFSQVGKTPNVVMVGSTNLTGYGTTVQYSDMYVYTNRADVFGVYARVFDAQKNDAPLTNPFVDAEFAGGSAYFFPRPGTTETTDPMMQRIKSLPADAGTTIGVAQYSWYDTRGLWLARALAQKKAAGANVVVVAGESVGAGVKGILRKAGIAVYPGVYADGKRIHNKLMFASYQNSTGKHTSVWTGSDNWADRSLRNDDTILQIDDDVAGFNKYVSFFNLLTRATGPAPLAPAAAAPPSAPSGVTATPGDRDASVSWQAASTTGAAVTGYRVTATPGGRSVLVGLEQTSASVTGLGNGTAYRFTVTATSRAGDSAASVPSAAVTPATAVLTLQQASRAVAENVGITRLSVTRGGNTFIPASARYELRSGTATAGSDLVLGSGTVSFAAGETSRTIPVSVLDDSVREGAETSSVSLSAPGTSTTLGSSVETRLTIAASDQRPDALISTVSSSGFLGNNVYNTTGAGQTRTVRARRTQTRSFYVRVHNDGNVSNTFTVKGSTARSGSTVSYYRGAQNVTASMRSSAGLRVALAPDTFTLVRVQVRAHRTARIGSVKPATVSARWTGDGTRTDVTTGVLKIVR